MQTGKEAAQQNRITALQVGDINKNKNLLRSAAAIERLRKEGRKIRFSVVGNILDRRVLKSLDEYDFVDHYPPMKKEDLILLYQQADLFIMASLRESFGLVYPEAMSQGLPVIYSQGQGFDGHFLNGEVGYAVDPLNTGSVASGIKNVLSNYSRLSYAAADEARQFEWGAISQNYDVIYRRILSTSDN